MEKGNVYISGEYINEYNHRIDIIWCIYVCKVRAIWIFGVCNEVGGRQAVCKMLSIYLAPNILETYYSFAPWDSQVALSGEKKAGWRRLGGKMPQFSFFQPQLYRSNFQ